MTNLITTVHVPDQNGGYTTFGPSDELPDWAAKRIGAHAFENSEHPFPDSNYPGKPEDESGSEREPGAIPPKAGKGSGRDNWAAYANDVDVDIPSDAGRDDIIAAIAVAGKPTEYEN